MNNEKYIAPKFDIEATQILKLDEKDIDDLKDRFPTEMEKMIVFFDIAHNTK
jgi:hypothetical protein